MLHPPIRIVPQGGYGGSRHAEIPIQRLAFFSEIATPPKLTTAQRINCTHHVGVDYRFDIYILCRVRSHQHASLHVALHVTQRHDGAEASDRTGVIGGSRCVMASQEAHCHSGLVLLFALAQGFKTPVQSVRA